MKANAGDSTVGVALESLQDGEGTIQVLISRRNKSLTVEKVEEAVTQRIAEMNVQDQVNQMIQMAQAQLTEAITSQSTIVADLSSQLNVQINRIATLESQIELITSQNNAIFDFAVALNAEKLIFKDELGNVDLLGGKLEAAEVVAGAFTVKAADPNAKTIGQSYIAAVTVDDNGDGIDDVTGTDGMSYEIKTTAARSNVRIYVTPVGSTENQVLYIADIKEGESFTVKVDQKVTHDVKFNWWIVQTE